MEPYCRLRNDVTVMARDGGLTVLYRCAHQACDQFTQEVTEDICGACPLRVTAAITPDAQPVKERDFGQPRMIDGNLVYPRTGFEPPVCPEGYKRKNDSPRSPDAWVFIPIWPKCEYRAFANKVRPCGCVAINAICMHPESKYRHRLVTLQMCNGCPLKGASCDGSVCVDRAHS